MLQKVNQILKQNIDDLSNKNHQVNGSKALFELDKPVLPTH
jgi:hypothetical protein